MFMDKEFAADQSIVTNMSQQFGYSGLLQESNSP